MLGRIELELCYRCFFFRQYCPVVMFLSRLMPRHFRCSRLLIILYFYFELLHNSPSARTTTSVFVGLDLIVSISSTLLRLSELVCCILQGPCVFLHHYDSTIVRVSYFTVRHTGIFKTRQTFYKVGLKYIVISSTFFRCPLRKAKRSKSNLLLSNTDGELSVSLYASFHETEVNTLQTPTAISMHLFVSVFVAHVQGW